MGGGAVGGQAAPCGRSAEDRQGQSKAISQGGAEGPQSSLVLGHLVALAHQKLWHGTWLHEALPHFLIHIQMLTSPFWFRKRPLSKSALSVSNV